jgi:phospholipid/cholesterol/gamma-HCH transport system substrate-binding protein
VFTLVRSLVGGANLRAYTGVPSDPPLPDGAERKVLIGDTAAELPRLVASARELLQNLAQLTAPDAPLATSLANLQVLTDRAKGPRGAMGAVLSEGDAQKISAALKNAVALLARLDGMAAKADTQVLGTDGLVPQGRATLAELGALLADTRASLKRVDAVLAEAQAVAGNVRGATTDLGALRSEVDATVRKVEQLVDEVNRKWPFARDSELKLK